MTPFTTSIEIDRPATAVFDYATDPTRFNQWQDGVVDGRMDHAGTPLVGTHCLTTRRIGGKNRSSTSTVTQIDPPGAWGVQGIDGPIRARVDLTVEPLTESRSRLTIAVDFEGHGIGKILVPLLVRREAQKEMPANLARLKEHIEPAGRRSAADPAP